LVVGDNLVEIGGCDFIYDGLLYWLLACARELFDWGAVLK